MENTLSIREAAGYFGVGETTIRRRIQHGQLRAFKQPTRGGFEWRVFVAAAPGGGASTSSGGGSSTTGGGVSTTGGGVSTTDVSPDDMATARGGEVSTSSGGVAANAGEGAAMASVLADELHRLHQHNTQVQETNLQLAGQVGFLQAKLQDAEDRIRLLEASKDTEPEQPSDEPAPPTPKRRTWWRRLFSEI